MNQSNSPNQYNHSDSTDEQLLERVGAGDDVEWTQFVETYSGMIYAWCRQCDLQPADALDVSQQVFYAIHRSLSTFKRAGRKGAFRSWLWTVVRNQVRNYLTRTLKGPRPEGGTAIQIRLLQEPESIEESSLSAINSTRTMRLNAVVDSVKARFDEKTWQCFWLTSMEGHTAVEVAKSLDMKPAAVRQAKYRVTKSMRMSLEDFSN